VADRQALFLNGKAVYYLKRVGVAAENIVQEAFETAGWGTWAANAYATILAKAKGNIFKRKQQAASDVFEGGRHTSPLIDTGQLRRAIASRVVT